MVEIYGLYDPESGALRYVGKAKSAGKRFKTHLYESKHGKRPVHNWIRKLLNSGKFPTIGILEVVGESDWKDAETRLIALHRKTSELLNLAAGGDSIPVDIEQRRKNAAVMNQTMATASPAWRKYVRAKQDLARMATRFRNEGDIFGWRCLKMQMHRYALARPELCGEWLLHDL